MGWRPDLSNEEVVRMACLLLLQSRPFTPEDWPGCACGYCPMDPIELVDLTVRRIVIVTSGPSNFI